MTFCAPLRLAAAAVPFLVLAPVARSQMIASLPPELLAIAASVQRPGENEQRLPSGKLQREEILKADHEQNLKDSAKIQELAADVEKEFKEHGYAVLPTNALREVEEIEKLAKRIRGRLRRF